MPPTAAALFAAVLLATALTSGVRCALAAPRPAAHTGGRLAVAILLALVVVGAVLRYQLVPPHHAMYLDEPWYAEAACALARGGRPLLCSDTWAGPSCSAYEKGIGWPVVLAPWALLGGCGTAIGIEVSRLLGTLSIVLAAVATRGAGGRWWQALIAAGLLALHPVHVAWSATGETNVAAAAALLGGLCGALWYLDRGGLAAAALAASGLGLATAMRPESMLAAWIVAAVVAVGPGPATRRPVAIAIAAVATAAALSALPLWTMNAALSSGAFLSARNVPGAIVRVAEGQAARVHLLVLVLAAIGAARLARSRPRAAMMLLAAGVALAAVVLAYDRFDERMLLGATVVLLPLAGCAAAWPSPTPRRAAIGAAAVVAAVILLWLPPLRAIAVPETQLLETQVARAAGAAPLAAGALIVAPHPAVLAANGTPPVMALTEALGDEPRLERAIASGRPVYFLCDMYCEADFPGGDAAGCDRVLERYAAAALVEATLPGRTYGLYRLSQPGAGRHAQPPCPRPRRDGAPRD